MEKAQSITALAVSPEVERKKRMIRYLIAMSIRVVCIIAALFLQGWLMWVAFAGAILLPYFAVVLANAQGATSERISLVTAKALSNESSDIDSSK